MGLRGLPRWNEVVFFGVIVFWIVVLVGKKVNSSGGKGFITELRDTLLQLMGNVKKSVAERTCHQRQYDRRVNKRQIQTQESEIDTDKIVDTDLVITQSSGTESEVQDDSNRSGNDTNVDDADISAI
nr:hypothetical protein [Tanacetum cinerariifolium]